MTFDLSAPSEVEQSDVPFAKPAGLSLLARAYRPKGAPHGFIQRPGPDAGKCIALMREFIGRQLGNG